MKMILHPERHPRLFPSLPFMSSYGSIPDTSSLGSTQMGRDTFQQEIDAETAERDRLVWPDKTLLKLKKEFLMEMLNEEHDPQLDTEVG